jgi:phosphate transport system permease protein
MLVNKKSVKGKNKTREIRQTENIAVTPSKINIGKKLCGTYKIFSYIAVSVGVFSLVSIIIFIFARGFPHISLSLLFGEFEYGGNPTIFPSIAATLMLVVLTSAVAFPVGIFAAVYLAEYAKQNSRLVKIIRVFIETLAGIPSIVYGLFGVVFFCGLMKMGTSIAAGCFTLALMIIPTTMRSTEEALKSVPGEFREASLALGCGKLRTIIKIVFPSALSGVLAGILLGVGRMVSESAPVLYTMGASIKPMPKGYSDSGTTLAVALYALVRENKYANEAYAAACVLIITVLALNSISTLLGSKLQKKTSGNKNGY